MTAIYLAAFVVGAVAVLAALLLADVGHGDGMPFLSLTGLSVALLGAGTGGLVGTWTHLGAFGSAVLAGACAVAKASNGSRATASADTVSSTI